MKVRAGIFFLLLFWISLLPGLSLASSLEDLDLELGELRSREETLRVEYQSLKDSAQSLSCEIEALRPPDGSEPGLLKRARLEGFLKESKEIETTLRETELRLLELQEKIAKVRDELISALTARIETLEKEAKKDKDPQLLSSILDLRRRKGELLDEAFRQLSPRVVLPSPDLDDSPVEVETKLEVLDLARVHLEKQLDNIIAQVDGLERQVTLNRGLREFLEDTSDFSREVSRRDELLARAPTSNEEGASQNDFGTIPIIIPDATGAVCAVCPQGEPTSSVQHLELSDATLSPGLSTPSFSSIEEKIEYLRGKRATIEQLLRRIDERQRAITKTSR